LLVYPNPFHNNLYLVFPSPVNDNVEVSLFDLTGKMNLRWEFPAFQGRTYIKLEDDLIGLSKGIYMLRTVTGSHTHITKLVRF